MRTGEERMSIDLTNATARGFLAANHADGSVELMKVYLLLFVFWLLFLPTKRMGTNYNVATATHTQNKKQYFRQTINIFSLFSILSDLFRVPKC